MTKLLFEVLLLLVVCVGHNFIEAANILFFYPGGTYSHKTQIWPYVTALADKGHSITFLNPHRKSPQQHPKVTDILSIDAEKFVTSTYGVDRFTNRRNNVHVKLWESYSDDTYNLCSLLLKSEDAVVKELIYNSTSKFDLMIINAVLGDCGYLVAKYLNVPYILSDSCGVLPMYPDIFGFFPESSWVPDMMGTYKYPMPFWERFASTLNPLNFYLQRLRWFYPRMENLMKEAFGMDASILELERNSSLVFINTHPATDYARSTPPWIVNIGGMPCWLPERTIPENFDRFMNESGKEGVVFISFGSSIELSKVPSDYQLMFLNLAKTFPEIRFIVKWSGPLPQSFIPAPNNILTSAWLPQRELLRHPKMRAFITHGGLNSIQEATYYAVPLIVLPLFADQDYNAVRVESQKVGLRLEIQDLTSEAVENVLNTVLSDQTYKKNMLVRSTAFRDRPQSPIELAVFWTEFALRHKDTSPLKPMNFDQSWFTRRSLDVYVVAFLPLGLLLLSAAYVLLRISSGLILNIVHVESYGQRSTRSSQKEKVT